MIKYELVRGINFVSVGVEFAYVMCNLSEVSLVFLSVAVMCPGKDPVRVREIDFYTIAYCHFLERALIMISNFLENYVSLLVMTSKCY